jgi:hypothetical protein
MPLVRRRMLQKVEILSQAAPANLLRDRALQGLPPVLMDLSGIGKRSRAIA